MHFIVKVFPEIIMKSAPVRKRFIKQLRDNLRHLLRPLGTEIRGLRDWEKVQIEAPGADEALADQVADILARTPGIANFARVQTYPLGDREEFLARIHQHWAKALEVQTSTSRI